MFAMAPKEKNRTSLLMPVEVVEEMRAEAKRLDRSVSWVNQYAWRVAKGQVKDSKPMGTAGLADAKEAPKLYEPHGPLDD